MNRTARTRAALALAALALALGIQPAVDGVHNGATLLALLALGAALALHLTPTRTERQAHR